MIAHMSDIYYEFARLQNFIKAHRKLIVLALAFVFLFFGFYQASAAIDWDPTDEISRSILSSTIGVLAAIVNVVAWAVGQLIIAVLGMLIIPILGYNNFGSSAIIDIGWPLVRDVVNMFVIVVLLVVAIKTILNSKSANWEQQLPRLFIAVILVNFSRTLTLLIVDAGQVVMFTFVNALRDIAAGNFVSLFQLNEILSLAQPSEENASYGFELFGFLGTAYANLVLLMIVLAVVVVLAIVFVYRIIMIWVLVILSPIAFFAQGLKDVLPQVAGQASKWWDKLVGVVTLGPILVFFLWLGLAAATSGAVATTEGFNLDKTEDSSSLYSEVFQVEQLLSMLIGVILIMVGFQAASGAAGAMGGIAATLINEKTGTQIAKNAARLPVSAGAWAGKRGLVAADRATGGGFARMGQKISQAAVQANIPIVSQIGSAVGGTIEGKSNELTKKDQKEAKERTDRMSVGQKTALLQMAQRGDVLTPKARRDAAALTKTFATDGKVRDDIEKGYTDRGDVAGWERFNKKQVQAARSMNAKGELGEMSDADDKAMNAFLTKNLNQIEVKDKNGVVNKAKTEDAQKKVIDDSDFDRKNLRKGGYNDPAIRKMLSEKKTNEFYKDENGKLVQRSELQAIEAGSGIHSSLRDHMAGRGADIGTSSVDTLGRAFEGGSMKVSEITVDNLQTNGAPDPVKVEKVSQALASSGQPLDGLDIAVANIIKPQLQALESAASTPGEARKYKKARFTAERMDADARAALDISPTGNFGGTAAAKINKKKAFNEIMTDQPIQAHKIKSMVTPTDFNEVAQELVQTASEDNARQLGNTLAQAQDVGNRELIRQAKAALEANRDALQAEISTLNTTTDKDKIKNIQKKQNSYNDALRYAP